MVKRKMLKFYKNKKVFITGHTGFKGTWLTRVLLFAGADVAGLALNAPTNPSLFELSKTSKDIKSFIADIRNKDEVIDKILKFQPDIIFHLAAQPLVRASYADPVYTYQTNIMGTINVLEALRQCASAKSFINITTDKVYKNKEWLWGYREDEELCGFDPYSNSKSCSELITYSYKNSFFNTTNAPAISTARSGNVIGGGDYSLDRIIPDCIRATQKNQSIQLRNPNSTRPYWHILDCLNGYLLLAMKQYNNKNLASSYNFGPNDESCISTGKLASLFCDAWGDGTNWVSVAQKNAPHEATFLKLQCEKAKNALDWQPKLSIEEAVKKVVLWHKALDNGVCASKITDQQIKEYFGV